MEKCIRCGEYITIYEKVSGTDLCHFCYFEEMKEMEETLDLIKKDMK